MFLDRLFGRNKYRPPTWPLKYGCEKKHVRMGMAQWLVERAVKGDVIFDVDVFLAEVPCTTDDDVEYLESRGIIERVDGYRYRIVARPDEIISKI